MTLSITDHAFIAYAAYLDNDARKALLEPLGLEIVNEINGDLTAFVAYYKNVDIVSFRGAHSLKDDWECMRFGRKSWQGGFVPVGIAEPLLDHWSELASAFRPTAQKHYDGHSLGGAHSHIATDLLPGTVISFASPHCWNGNKRILKNHLRIIFEDDDVPSLPPLYDHYCQNAIWLRLPSYEFVELEGRRNILPNNPIAHSMLNYIAASLLFRHRLDDLVNNLIDIS